MSYIGRGLQSGAFRQLDDISSGFDGSDTTHTMQVNSTNVTVGDVNQILLSLGGVIQKPGTDFTVSSSTLTFTTAPAANTSFFAILLGSDNGGTVTPTDGSVTSDKLAYPFVVNEDGAAASDFRVESDSNTHMLFVDAGNNKIGINTSSPDDALHVKGNLFLEDSSPEITLETTNSSHYNWQIAAQENVANSFEIAVGSADADASNDSFTSTLLINSIGAVTMPLQPAFLAIIASTQSNIANGNSVTFGTEIYDQNGDFASSTFTAPVTGKYQFNFCVSVTELDYNATFSRVFLTTSNRTFGFDIVSEQHFDDADPSYATFQGSMLMDMDANDTATLNWSQHLGDSTADVFDSTYFSGYLAC
jgi:hypothetical protein